ncbi:hypothetical protein HJ526_15665 [Donghicola sp. C2-DW-16]|uniref:ATP synthase subunit I n=1 Tax=Donghicola mangrovi TaxID=2729614 RepID=A0ABX2PIP6_9RHOB|nr:ATP synthase subunit I [Donghicola mangrovi]NVO28867.1 hypothetical protein [Donghicola mangrovi]
MTYMALYTVLGFAAGLTLGAVHFLTLGRLVDMLVSGTVAWPLILQLVRFAVLGAVLYGLALLGALPLIAGTAGIVLARVLVLRRTKGTA